MLILSTIAHASFGTTTWMTCFPAPAKQVSGFLEQFSDVKCTEQVKQEKLGKDDKVELKEESTYDYLVILTNPGGELTLDESRLAVKRSQGRQEEPLHAGQQRIRHPVPDLPSLLRRAASSSPRWKTKWWTAAA